MRGKWNKTTPEPKKRISKAAHKYSRKHPQRSPERKSTPPPPPSPSPSPGCPFLFLSPSRSHHHLLLPVAAPASTLARTLDAIAHAPMEGAGAGAAYTARTAEEVFRDLRGRRAGMIRALTDDVDKFFKLCDPEKENLCLYGYPNETWEVTLPAEEVPPEIPEPALGINFARDGMNEKDWLALVAVHSDSWLLSVAFYFGARFGFDKETRRRLFNMINNLPTIYEVVTGAAKRQSKEKTPNTNSSSKSNKPSSKVQSRAAEPRAKAKLSAPKDEEEDSGDDGGDDEEEEHDNTLCGTCGTNDGKDEFWICCDNCEKWYHGKCVKITPARAEHIKQYRCPECGNGGSNKRIKT